MTNIFFTSVILTLAVVMLIFGILNSVPVQWRGYSHPCPCYPEIQIYWSIFGVCIFICLAIFFCDKWFCFYKNCYKNCYGNGNGDDYSV